MLRLVTRRLVLAVPLIFSVSVVTFLLTALIPGDPAYLILGGSATPAQVAAFNTRMGFDLPLWEQYWRWLSNALSGDLGTSFLSGEPVWTLVTSRLSTTLSLVVCGTLVGGIGGVLLGIVSAVRPGVGGRITDVVQLLGFAVPNFWLGLILIEVFAVKLALFPPTGYVAFTDSPVDWALSLVLPVLALSLPAFAGIAKATRDGVRDAMGRDFVKVLRGSGVPERRIIFIHALRSASIPLLTFIGLLFIGLMSGTVFVETVFAMQGLGSLAQSSALGHDLTVIQAIAVVFCLIVVVANLLTDLAYGWANPKARAS